MTTKERVSTLSSSVCPVFLRHRMRRSQAVFVILITFSGCSILFIQDPESPSFSTLSSVSPVEGDEDEDRWWRRQGEEHPHPYAGARRGDKGGGWVVDPSIDRLHPFDVGVRLFVRGNKFCPSPATEGIEGKEGRIVLEEVRKRLKEGVRADGTPGSRILCMVYTHSNNHDSLRSIARTWARQCDGFFAASNVTDHSIGAIDLPHQGLEVYSNMWQKVRSMWAYVHEHYRDEFDFYHIGGDDIYMWPDHLRAYLASAEVAEYTEHAHIDNVGAWLLAHGQQVMTAKPRPMLFGEPSANVREDVYANGAAGYTLNRAALELYAREGLRSFRSELERSFEDVQLGMFFHSRGVPVVNTLDSAGRMRYWPQALGDEWKSAVLRQRIQDMFNLTVLTGIWAVSDRPVGCHLKHVRKRLAGVNASVADLIIRYHAFLHAWCKPFQ